MTTPVSSRLQRTGDTYLLDDADLKGGYRVVATLTERNAIGLTARKSGMTVFVQAEQTEYVLKGGTGNANWTVKTPITGKLHNVHSSIVRVSTLQQFDPYSFEVYAKTFIVDYFNALAASARILNSPTVYFKLLRAVGASASTTLGNTLPPNTTYLGDATFLYDGVASNDATLLDVSKLVCISKSLIPLGDSVIAAMDEYALRKDAEV